ncbi:sugar ABC transporter substrate-binding protein [Lapillicoccus jejuensis]|uniref:Carbohydrate ABC transporter substrate-binding protein (CUT1 family) n=1 Tax=Lapillicoccus jejuensis TaxID=402171 RepID=A0A542E0L8_9MICO|nr:maltose ABC transporter substrate-binding protein [Lapillicoccus jejuensis]TQJ08888.1 carbohydrate ABC transporter substrate-binding protein (CUT1 family) [Lapillicoccus jejuensis]
MHKRAYATVVAASGAVALLVSGCGGGGSSTGGSTGAAAPATTSSTTTTAAASPTTTGAPKRDANADLVIWTDADRAQAVTKYADAFGQENGVTVAVQISTDVRQQFKDATKVGQGPDVIVGAHDWLGELVQNATVAPINLSPDVTAKLAPNAVAATKFNGQTYGVPYAVENIALMRNTALAPDAPTTMDQLVAEGTKIKDASGGKVTNVLIQQVGKTGNAYYSYPYLAAYGGGIFATKANGDYDSTKLLVDSAGSLKGAAELAKLGKSKVLSTNVGDDNAEALFDAGKAPFFITGPWAQTNAKKAGIKYAVSNLPSLAGGGPMEPFLGVQMFYVSAKAKNPTIAQEFVTNYVTREDVQMALFEATGRPPALTTAYEKAAAEDPMVKAFYEAGKNGKPMPNIPAMNSVWGPLGQAAADVISGADPTSRFTAAQKEIAANIAKG